MTAVSAYLLRCDACGAWHHPEPPVGTVGPARSGAKATGWLNKMMPNENGSMVSRDYCPKCHDSARLTNHRPVVLMPEEASYVASVLGALLYRDELVHRGVAASIVRRIQTKEKKG